MQNNMNIKNVNTYMQQHKQATVLLIWTDSPECHYMSVKIAVIMQSVRCSHDLYLTKDFKINKEKKAKPVIQKLSCLYNVNVTLSPSSLEVDLLAKRQTVGTGVSALSTYTKQVKQFHNPDLDQPGQG